ncbi:MAG: cytochrome-c peroxidase [Sphingobacteriaceae bacterium]|nr:cytochrome-c peroxidase [Sphingobacteriaceae bacterium]
MRIWNKILFIFFVTCTFSCKVDPRIIEELPSDELKEIIPDGWPQPVYTFSTNAITEEKFILGRSLFYETLLSKDNTISCGSCHQQFVAFAHADHDVSHGINGLLGTRNSPALFNLTWHTSFMHDGGVNHIEVQPLAPIQNPIEMDENISNVLTKLSASAKYRKLFNDAYGDDEVTSQRMFRAMSLFMGMMYSYNSKYDRVRRNEGSSFDDSEARGYQLFLSKCNNCHTEPLFSDFQMRNNGIAVIPSINDSGRAHITGIPTDKYKFKTPSLRNIAITGPYMHDGRFTTLQQCLNHYNTPFTNTVNLDPLLQTGIISLSNQDKTDIINFLHTLTDYKFINDKRFADPNF